MGVRRVGGAGGGTAEGPASVVAAHQGFVRAFFARRCASREDAEDLAQEAFCAIIEAWPRFRGDSAPSTWIWSICRHVLLRHIDTRRRRERAMLELAGQAAAPVSDNNQLVASSGGSGPALHRREEERIELGIIIDGLGCTDRLLYECHYARGLPVAETARLLGRPEGTIKYQLHILRERLRKALGSGAASRDAEPSG